MTTNSLSQGKTEKLGLGPRNTSTKINKTRLLLLLGPALLSLSVSGADGATDYLSVPGPINVNELTYDLAWSSHPKDNFYVQEYTPKGETPEHYSNMLTLQVVTGNKSVKEVLGALVRIIEERGKTDPLVHHEVFQSAAGKDEYLIDFLQSEGSGPSIVEWNAYRYKTFTDKSGHTGVLLFGISRRAYGEQIQPFLVALKTERIKLRNALIAHPLPEIAVKQ
jgi:hypothetical protein